MDPRKRERRRSRKFLKRSIQSQNQAYQLPLYEKGWSIYLQLLLLDAIRMFGSENWQMIGNYLKSEFSAQQIRDHYYRIYGDHDEDGLSFLKKNSLIDNQQYDPYIAADAHEKIRIQNQRRERKVLQQQQQKIQKPTTKIPMQFGYEQTKKIFNQSYNQQAQVMLIGLKIQETDSIQMKKSKIQVLKLYNKMIEQRKIIQKKVIQHKLMECKYRLNKSDILIPKNLQNSQGQIKNARRGRKRNIAEKQEPQKRMSKRQKYIQNQIIFRIRRTIPQSQLSQGLYVAYMKVTKFDQNQKLKQLLKRFQKLSQQLKVQKEKIMSTV